MSSGPFPILFLIGLFYCSLNIDVDIGVDIDIDIDDKNNNNKMMMNHLRSVCTSTRRRISSSISSINSSRSSVAFAHAFVPPLPLPRSSSIQLQYSRFTTKPTFIDENPSNPESYQLPPFQEGDDVLTNLRKNQRILSFGDVHGDILALFKFLQASQLLHPNSTITNPIWDGGDSILVQCGDILDRGPNELLCFRFLVSLAQQAEKASGKVILLHGNHEALNSNGLFHYTDPNGDEEIEVVLGQTMDTVKSEGTKRWRIQYAGNQPSRWSAFEPGGWLSKPLLCNMSVAAVVGKTVFVHAGLTKQHLLEYGGIQNMNTECRTWYDTPLPSELQNDDGYLFQSVDEVIQNANLRAKIAMQTMPKCLGGGIGAASPVWMREYSSPADTTPKNSLKAQKMMNECLDELSKEIDCGYNIERMVMGHTPQSKINTVLENKAWRIDVGASTGVLSGTPEVLEIIHCGGENDEDVINILTVDGERIPAIERQIVEIPF
mmetsp:Transcript_26972/g.31375  ORF Transcript_26972/g.31375 Transcript_26972/m.31375 type:complete len:491 (+) Transcript_26972:87-1559(+)